MFCALFLTAFSSCAIDLPFQDEVEFGRLATEQRQVAEQLRRLENLLAVLEKKDREEGRLDRAEMLRVAAERLASSDGSGDLAGIVEGLAREIGAMHSGNALEGQQQLIEVLQELLDFLIDNERREQKMMQMKELEERVAELDKFINEKSVTQRFWGFFTFVNIIWLCSIIGIAVSVGPCIYDIIGPWLERLLTIAKDVIVWIFKKIIIPIIEFMHNWGVFEVLGYLLCFQLVYEGS